MYMCVYVSTYRYMCVGGHAGTCVCMCLIHYFYLGVPFLSPLLPHLLWQTSGMPRGSLPSPWDPELQLQLNRVSHTESYLEPPRDLHLNSLQMYGGPCVAPTTARLAASCTASACRLTGSHDRDREPTVPPLHCTATVRLHCAS